MGKKENPMKNIKNLSQKKQKKLSRIMDLKKKRMVIIPMDHGVSDGPIPGLINMEKTIKAVKKGGADAIVIHKGIYKICQKTIGDLATIIHISASSVLGTPLHKVLVATPQEVLDLGAQGVSIHINLGNPYEGEMLKDLGQISRECHYLELPLLAMMYVREEKKGQIINHTDAQRVSHAARIAAELGADIVKVPYTGSAASFRQVVEGCPVPVVIAGGAKGSEQVMLNSIKGVIKVGGAGVSTGRNVFQHKNPSQIIKAIRKIVHS